MRVDGTENTIVQIIETAVKLPAIKVNRNAFLLSVFEKKEQALKENILQSNPIEAGISREELMNIARALVTDRTVKSTAISFAAGLPGGFALAATIPADTLQYFGVSLRLAQELAYLYGEEDLWRDGSLSEEKIINTFVIYYGVMFGSSGASATLRVMASQLGRQALKKIPQMTLMKTFYYPVIKSIVRFFGGKMTKKVFGKVIAKVIPVLGGVASAAITFATLKPMGLRLVDVLDEAKFSYTKDELDRDLIEIKNIIETQEHEEPKLASTMENVNISDEIKNNKELLDNGIISESEFNEIKKRLIEKL